MTHKRRHILTVVPAWCAIAHWAGTTRWSEPQPLISVAGVSGILGHPHARV